MKKALLLSIILMLTCYIASYGELHQVQTPKYNSQFFIENKGQYDPQVKYLAKLGGLNYWITNTGATYDYYQIEREENLELKPLDPIDAKDPRKEMPKIKSWYGHVIQNTMVGMNPNFIVIPQDEKEGKYNYFIGNDPSKWYTNVSLFSSLKLVNIYNGIDMVYYYNENAVRYDFIIAPNSDPSQIKMKFVGQYSYEVSPNGNLIFKTSVGDVAHSKLYAYQETNGTSIQVECSFVDKGNGEIGFQVKNYDASKPLIIDPTVNFVSYFGGNSTDYAYAINIDNNGNPMLAGYTYSSNLPLSTGAYQTSLQSTPDGFVTKLNATGTALVFSTFLGGNNTDYVYGLGVDANGNAYIGGYTYSTNLPVSSGAFQTSISTTPSAYVVKINNTGSSLGYCTYVGGNNTTIAYSVTADQNGYAYLTGYTYATNYPVTSGAFQSSIPYSSYPNIYCTKLNQTGTGLVFSTYYGSSSGYGYGYGVAADANGYAYITGYCYATNFPTTSGCYKPTGTTTPEMFIVKFNSAGTGLSYGTYINGNNTDIAYGIGVDPSGQAAITGYTYSSDYPITPGAIQSTISSTPEAFALKMNATGTGLVFSTFLGGNSTDYGRGVACDGAGNTYIGGYDYSTDFKGISPDGRQTVLSTTPDAFFTALSPTGSLLYGTFIGGNSTDVGYYFQCVGANSNNQVAVGGYTSSTNFPTTTGAFQTTQQSSPDGWIAKFTFDPPLSLSTTTVTPYQMCKGGSFAVSYKINSGKVKADNYFKIQLSDENGSFTSPREVGSLFSSTDGTVNCTLPTSSLPASTLYKVRAVATSPASTGTESSTLITVMPSPISFNITGQNGFCANAKFGSEIGLEDTEKYTLYQLYNNGIKVGNPVVGTDAAISFGKFKVSGLYTVEATSPFGCKSTMSGSIDNIMIPLPVAYNVTGGSQYYNISGPGTFCEGSDGVAIGLNHGEIGINYQLQLNGVDVSIPVMGRGDEISFGYFTQEGTYTVKAISVRGGCENIMNNSITVKMLPAPTVYDVLSTGSYCEGSIGSEIKLSNSDIGFTYQLYFNGKTFGKSIAGNGSAISFGKFNTTGTYSVLATNPSTGCTKLMNGTINLTPVPSPMIFDVRGVGHYCTGTNGTVLSLSNSQQEAVYELYLNNQPTGTILAGTGSALNFDPVTAEGNYSIWATSIQGNCTIAMNGNVQVTQIPLPDVTIVGNKTPEMNSVEKYSINSPQENETYLWKATNGTIDGSNTTAEITVNWANRRTGTVELYRKNGWGCSNWEVDDINLKNVLVADFTAKQTKGDAPFAVEFTNNSTGFISDYIWEFGDGISSPQVNPTHTYKQPGTYSVKLTISHDGDSKISEKSDFVTVYPANSIEEDGQSFNSNKTVGISLIEPNPAKSEIRCNYYLSFDQNIEISVYDVIGNRVIIISKGYDTQGTHNLTIDVSKLVNGSYYLQINSTDGVVTKKFSIVK